MAETVWVLGIDAGGTSVRAALSDARTGQTYAQATVNAAADGGPEIIPGLITTVVSAGGIGAQEIRAVCAGITKITRAGVGERWEASLRGLLPNVASPLVVPDFVIAFHGAIPSGKGAMVIAGTGSVVYGEDGQGTSTRVGGRGWEFGDEGSGAWLTAEAIRRTLRALDGMEASTPLTQALCAELGTADAAVLGETARSRAVQEGRGFLVPLLLARAQNGDTEAANLFVGAAGWLGAQVRAAVNRLHFGRDETFTVATVGGLWEARDLLREPFQTVLHRWFPNAAILTPEAAPVHGAVRLAARTAAATPFV